MAEALACAVPCGYRGAHRSTLLARCRHRSCVGCGSQAGGDRCAFVAGDSGRGYVRYLHPRRCEPQVMATMISGFRRLQPHAALALLLIACATRSDEANTEPNQSKAECLEPVAEGCALHRVPLGELLALP